MALSSTISASPKLSAPLARRWRRYLSLSYEALLLAALILSSSMLFEWLWPRHWPETWRRWVQFVYQIAVIYAYFIYCWWRGGQTLAMTVWRIRLTDVEGSAPRLRALHWRFLILLCLLSPLLPCWLWARYVPQMHYWAWGATCLALLPYLWALWDREQQFLHDRLAKTRLRLST